MASAVVPQRTDRAPHALLPIMPPTVQRLCVEGSGPTRSPWAAAARLTSSRTAPGRTVAVSASGSRSRIPPRCREVSTTQPGPDGVAGDARACAAHRDRHPRLAGHGDDRRELLAAPRRDDGGRQHPVVRGIRRVQGAGAPVGVDGTADGRAEADEQPGHGVGVGGVGGGTDGFCEGDRTAPGGSQLGVTLGYGCVDRSCRVVRTIARPPLWSATSPSPVLDDVVPRCDSCTRNHPQGPPRHAPCHRRRPHDPPAGPGPRRRSSPARARSSSSPPRRSGYEGEGFPVRRAFAGALLEDLDPFIHLDQMGEVEYAPGEAKGTPWHPHRGFETVTYMLDGVFEHSDSQRRRRRHHQRRHAVDDRRRRASSTSSSRPSGSSRRAACSTASSCG